MGGVATKSKSGEGKFQCFIRENEAVSLTQDGRCGAKSSNFISVYEFYASSKQGSKIGTYKSCIEIISSGTVGYTSK